MAQSATYDLMVDAPKGTVFWLRLSGVAAIALGFIALIFPFAATLAAEILFGAVLAVMGGLQLIGALTMRPTGNRLWMALFGLVALIAGVLMLAYPLEGALTLTIVLASFFVAGGVFQMIAGWQMRQLGSHDLGLSREGWGWAVFSGALSVLLGMLLIAGLPGAAIWALGLLLGIDLIFLGTSEMVLAQAIKRFKRENA